MIKYKKNLGQNFLINNKILNKISKIIKPKKKHNLLEIGSGYCNLTKKILKFNKNIIAIEIDKYLIKKIPYKIKKKIKIINKNILKINFKKINKINIRIYGNIPYYISKKILFKLLKNNKYIKDIHLLIQKELAISLISKPNNKKYNKLSVLFQIYFEIKIIIKNISKKYFIPKPKVNSSLIKLTPKKKYVKNKFKIIKHILNNCFYRKNKKLFNNIKNIININKLKSLKIKNERINKINIKNFIKLSNIFNKIKK